MRCLVDMGYKLDVLSASSNGVTTWKNFVDDVRINFFGGNELTWAQLHFILKTNYGAIDIKGTHYIEFHREEDKLFFELKFGSGIS